MFGSALALITYERIGYLLAFSGESPGKDAPDIVANTFLENVTDEELSRVSIGFLKHRERELNL